MEVYCIMVKKEWVTPRAMVEEFEANEYVRYAGAWHAMSAGQMIMNNDMDSGMAVMFPMPAITAEIRLTR